MSFNYPSSIRERGGSDCSSSSSSASPNPVSSPTSGRNPFQPTSSGNSFSPSDHLPRSNGNPFSRSDQLPRSNGNPFSHPMSGSDSLQRPKFTHCMFCKSNGEPPEFFNSHTLKDDYVIFSHLFSFLPY